MEIFVYSRDALQAVKPHEIPHVVISITSSPDDVVHLKPNEMRRGVLQLAFPDVEAPSDRFTDDELFSRAQAAQIWDFLLEYRSQIERILVHCDAGVSRSSAVAAAIARVLNGDDTEFWGGRYRPNMRVYRTLLEAYAESSS